MTVRLSRLSFDRKSHTCASIHNMDPTPSIPAPSLFSLSGQNILITGATRGLGAACALGLAQAGAAAICLVQRHPTPSSPPNMSTFETIRKECPSVRVEVVYCDLGDMEDVKKLFPQALQCMGGQIHVLVNCAGIQRRGKCLEFTEDNWDEVLQTNLKSVFLLSQAAGRHMVPLRRGKIINFCSIITFQGGLTVPAYAAAKGGLGQLTKAMANEWSKENVQVNAICPGYIETDMNEQLLEDPDRLRQISERIPAGRWGQSADLVGPVVFLASKASQFVCGELLVVDGGWMGR